MRRKSEICSHCQMAEKDCSDGWNFHFFGWFSIVIGYLGGKLLVQFLVWYSALYSINSLSNDIIDVTLITTVAHCKHLVHPILFPPFQMKFSLTLHISKLTNQWFEVIRVSSWEILVGTCSYWEFFDEIKQINFYLNEFRTCKLSRANWIFY